MNNQQVNQIAPVNNSNETVPAATQAPPPNNPMHQSLPVGAWQLRFQNVQQAKNWIDRVKVPPHVDPNIDATINVVDANRQTWVIAMFHAVWDLRHCSDNSQMLGHFTPTQRSCFDVVEVEATCHVLVDALLEHCRLGFRGLEKFNVLNNTASREPADETANCHDRANNVLIALRTWKSICKGIIEEEDKMWQLVNAPLSTIKKKNTEAIANARKKAGVDAAKTARQVLANNRPGQPSVAAQSAVQYSVASSHGNIPTGFSAQTLQQAPLPQGISVTNIPQGSAPAPHVAGPTTAAPFGGPTAAQSQTSTIMCSGREFEPHHNTITATIPIGHPSQVGSQNDSSILPGFGVVPDEQTSDEVEPRDELLTEDVDSANPFAGLSEVSYDPRLDAEALFPGGLCGFGDSYSSFAPTRDAFKMFDVDAPLGAYSAGMPPPKYPPGTNILPPAYSSRPPLPQPPSRDVPQFGSMPHQSQAPRPPLAHSMHRPSLVPAATNNGENVQNNPSNFSNMADFNNIYNHSDHRSYFFGQGSLHEVARPPFATKSSHSATSSMGNAQPRIDTQVNNAQDVNVTPNTQAAHSSTQLPQPVLHGDCPHIGSKRAREEHINETPLPPSSRLKRDDTGMYTYDDSVSSTDSEDQTVNVPDHSKVSGHPGPMAGDGGAGDGHTEAHLDENIL